jgi:HEAT repeat protein
MKNGKALPQLITTLTDEDSDVRAATAEAILKFSAYDSLNDSGQLVK